MGLSLGHITNELPKSGRYPYSVKKKDEFDRVHRLILEVQADLINGVLRSEIREKFKQHMYDNQVDGKDISERQVDNYIQRACEMLKEDRIEKQNELKDMLYSQYMQQYRDAVLVGNTLTAKSVLDSIAKIFLPSDKSTNVQVNAGDSSITIKFGYTEDDNENDE